MDRGASAAFLTELVKSTNSPCFLIDAYFDDGTISVTDAWRSVASGGRTYTANGHFLSFDGLSEAADLQVPQITVSLSAVDLSWVSIALTKNHIDRRLVISKAFLDYTQAVITSPVVVFDGRMDGMSIADSPDGKCSVTVNATSQFSDFYRKAGRHTNSQEQNVFFPGDKFFDYAVNLNKQIRWGAA
jgi:hypothetical protein